MICTEQLTLTRSEPRRAQGMMGWAAPCRLGKSGRATVMLETGLQYRTEAPQSCLWQKSPGT